MVKISLATSRETAMPEGKRKKRRLICDAEVDEDEVICPECGSYLEESAYDVMGDEGN